MSTAICFRATKFGSRERLQRLFNLHTHFTDEKVTGPVGSEAKIQIQVFGVKIFLVPPMMYQSS